MGHRTWLLVFSLVWIACGGSSDDPGQAPTGTGSGAAANGGMGGTAGGGATGGAAAGGGTAGTGGTGPTDCGEFDDVAPGSYYCDSVDRIREAGITQGCNPPDNTLFCPDDSVTRAAMATFLVRALDTVGITSAATHPCGFTDVPESNVHRDAICKLRDLGVTLGCNPPTNDQFCPSNVVTRGAMAAFVERSLRSHSTLALPLCDESNYTDVPADHLFNDAICSLWRGGVAISFLHPDPQRNRYNNTFGPAEPLLRRDAAVFLDRAYVQRPVEPLGAVIDDPYLDFLAAVDDYGFASDAYRPTELLALIYAYRAADKVANPPASFDAAALLALIRSGADEIAVTYANDCYAGHDGDGTAWADGCPRFGDTENFDRGSTATVALLEAVLLLHEIGDSAGIVAADDYWQKALWVTAHVNDDHRVTTPCAGWKNPNGDVGIKWNLSNRWAIANHLVYEIRARGYRTGDGSTYETHAVGALSCFRNDLRNATRYHCNGGARCYDSSRGPWWNGWHSNFHTNIMEDQGHGNASGLIVFYAIYDQWDEGAFDYGDLGQFKLHWQQRRRFDATTQYQFDQYPDSDTHPGNTCASPTLTGDGTCDQLAGSWDSQKVDAWIRWAALYGSNDFREEVRNLSPDWAAPGGTAGPLELVAGTFALFGEVGTPRRLGY